MYDVIIMMVMLNDAEGIWGASCVFTPLWCQYIGLPPQHHLSKNGAIRLRTTFDPLATCTCFIVKLGIEILLHADNFAVNANITLLPPPVVVSDHIHNYA